MKTNLSSQITLNRVSPRYYRPENAFERSVLTRLEKIPTDIYESPEEGANQIALDIAQMIRDKQKAGRFCVLALAGGNSPRNVYSALVRMHKEEGLSFRNVVVFNLYEYYPLASDAVNSNLNSLKEMLLDHVDIDMQNVFSPSGTIAKDTIFEYCRLYEQRIESFGGIDIAVLGIGRVGNIGFNEPGSRLNSTTRLILLDSDSRNEASKMFGSIESTPVSSITMGVATILSAKKVYLLAWGEEKAKMVKECVEGNVTDTIPASYLQTHNNAHIAIDLSAAANLTRIQRPWLVTSCEWNDKLIRSAIVWLCQLTGKPILKLTNKDYNENGLSELLALYGSAYNVNIKIFNDLQHTITGWPGGKPNADDTYRPERAKPYPKRVIVFSPHPDDDVISMGGTIRRLVEQKHDVHVAYETSGNIAVGDEEVIRFLHFINGFNQLFNNSEDQVINEKYTEIRNYLKDKKDGDMDTRDILTIKGLIRRGEARTACTYNNIPLDHCHFLDLPFYETGKIQKNPISEADVEIKELGYRTIFWSLAYVDWKQEEQPTHEEAMSKLLKRVHPGAIVLLHNTSRTNGEILDEVLTKWEEMGYHFASLEELVSSGSREARSFFLTDNQENPVKSAAPTHAAGSQKQARGKLTSFMAISAVIMRANSSTTPPIIGRKL